MSKTTIAIIIVLYAVSIFLVGVFGLTIKVYEKVKYVKEIQIEVEAEDKESFKLLDNSKTKEIGEDNKYNLVAYFYKKHQVVDGKKQLQLNILNHVTYTTGDLAASNEKIKYVYDNNMQTHIDNGTIVFNNGILLLNDPGTEELFVFQFRISPEHASINGSSAIVTITVVNFDY